jgi:hypothetical protein
MTYSEYKKEREYFLIQLNKLGIIFPGRMYPLDGRAAHWEEQLDRMGTHVAELQARDAAKKK